MVLFLLWHSRLFLILEPCGEVIEGERSGFCEVTLFRSFLLPPIKFLPRHLPGLNPREVCLISLSIEGHGSELGGHLLFVGADPSDLAAGPGLPVGDAGAVLDVGLLLDEVPPAVLAAAEPDAGP